MGTGQLSKHGRIFSHQQLFPKTGPHYSKYDLTQPTSISITWQPVRNGVVEMKFGVGDTENRPDPHIGGSKDLGMPE